MKVRDAVKDLLSRGYTETRIASEIGVVTGIEVSQSSINRIKSGAISDPAYSVGAAILDIHRKVARRRKVV